MVTSSSSESKPKSKPDTKRVDDIKSELDLNLELGPNTKGDQVPKKKVDTDTKSDCDSTSSSDLGHCSKAYKSSSHFSKVPRPKDFTKGENFSRFCDRFKEYVYLTRLNDPNLYIYLLQLVDNETYELLKKVRLKRREKGDVAAFCKKFVKAIYPDGDAVSLKSEVLTCKQKSDENIDKFQYRLLEKASIAFSDKKVRDENCLIAFLQGVRDISMKIKLNEAEIQTFDDAVKLAKRLERVNNMFEDTEIEINSILKESSSINRENEKKVSFDRGRRRQRDRIRYQSRSESSEYKSPRFSSSDSMSSTGSFKQRYVPGAGGRNNSRINFRPRSYSRDRRGRVRNNYNYQNDNNSRNRYYNNNYNRGAGSNLGDSSFPRRETTSYFTRGQRGQFDLDRSRAYQGIKRCFGCGSASHLIRTCSQNTDNRNGVYSNTRANPNSPVLNPTSPSFTPYRYTTQNNTTAHPNLN